MGKIFLFGSNSVSIPEIVSVWMEQYSKEGHQFLVGDSSGLDTKYHTELSRIGCKNVEVRALDRVKNNLFGFPENVYRTELNADEGILTIFDKDGNILLQDTGLNRASIENLGKNRMIYQFTDRQMAKDCDIAICIYDGKAKNELEIIRILNILQKPCYTFTVQN